MENEKIIEEFDKEFSLSEFWFVDNYPKNYNSIKKFIKEKINLVIKGAENEVDEKIEKDYQIFIKEQFNKALEKQKSDFIKEIEKLEVVDTANSGDNSPNAYMDRGAYMFKNQILEVLRTKSNKA